MTTVAQSADARAGGEPPAALVYSLFFLSGVAALVYEASWSRLVGLAVGQTAQAAALVLAAYFTGLAIGQFLGGRLAARVPPLLGYGAAELVAAAWSCLVPALLDWVGGAAGPGGREWFRDSAGGRAAWGFVILLPATIPLGATLPLVVEALAGGASSRHRGAIAYGLNTAGGVVGIVAASAVLLNVVGVRASGFLAAVLSAACWLTACVAAFFQRGANTPGEAADIEADRPGGSSGWLAVAAISGFGILCLEVLYTRMFSLVLHNSVYTFGAVVAVFLLALSLGAAVAVRLGRRWTPRRVVTASFSLGGLALAASVAAFPGATGLSYFSSGETFSGYLAGAFALVAVFVLPPVVLLGMTLPAAIQAASGGRAVGRVTAVNTLAGAVGAIAAGFLLPPLVGLWSAFAVFVALFGVAGAVLLLRGGNRKLAAASAATTAGLAVLIVSGRLVDWREGGGVEVVRRWESAYGWVDVVRTGRGDSLAVRQNLHYRHGSTAYAVREYRQGRLPLLLHPRPTEVAFLGLGTGLTAAPAVVDRDVERAVVVELIPEVVEASRLLAAANLGIVDHPKVEVRIDDARHYLLRTNRRFDVIVSDLFVPWESRTAYLYTVEFYETARHRLKPGGLFCQWIALYQLGPEEFELIADSFSTAFPHATIWWGQFDAKYPIVALVGSEESFAVGHARLEDRLEVLNAMRGGPDPDLRNPSDLPALYLGDWPRNPARRLNTDEHPRLEFAAPVSHRAGRTLSGTALRQYFDRVLTRLPSGGVRFGAEADAAVRDDQRRRAVQRLSLFGEVKP
ncbi:spermine synthase : Spermine/spermidine synthase family protein OS=Rhodopirellula europaea SH398 GN=RESH_06305 PE=4 SV=1: Spermine_synth [Gemmataceae bacterium]|nr:spermine synthase : Spermine/spermidine synthase family protein OS=Rhodopirellula europaea SH398 GN=RESH_06305 PE=4 SV=1: Spermine_synth [Gemmataceae bacterium]VTU01675.1 spermine synthase : Spermine/spermidine synthase family protein OS=Rhodopirellula europaea SH398 GN=RESH_06305 PE=4 SV=1: Spermine_synth [Gemmataceae bacterium]